MVLLTVWGAGWRVKGRGSIHTVLFPVWMDSWGVSNPYGKRLFLVPGFFSARWRFRGSFSSGNGERIIGWQSGDEGIQGRPVLGGDHDLKLVLQAFAF